MNEKLQVALAEIIETTIQAKDFCLEQAPEVISQLLAWKFTMSVASMLFAIFLCSLPVILNLVAYKKFGKAYLGDGYGSGIFHIHQVLWLMLLIPICEMPIFDWIQIWIAPKVYLLEYASQFVS